MYQLRRVLFWITVATWAAAVRGLDDEMAELARTLRENCAAETGVNVQLIDAVNAGGELESTPDAALKCYIKCFMETAGMLSEGEVDVEAVVAIMPDDMRAKNEGVVRSCGTQRGQDHCDTAYLTQVCWQKSNKKDYFLV